MEKPLRLDPAVWTVLERIASDDDVSVGQIIRDAVNRDIRRRAEAKTPVRADERLVAPLRALLAGDFGLILQSRDTGDRICKASELGYSYSALLRRFDCVFPGHAHSAPLRRIRGH